MALKHQNNAAPNSLMHIRMSESLRAWQLICAVLIGIIVMLSIGVASLFPLKEVRYKYVEFLGAEDVYYKVLPGALPKEQKQLLVRKALRKYVNDRNTKDDLTERVRAKEIRAMSTSQSWSKFKEQFEAMYTRMDGVTRDVQIIQDSALSADLHQVEFTTIDQKDGMQKTRNFIATMKYRVEDKPTVRASGEALNPLGVVVEQYSVSERNIDN